MRVWLQTAVLLALVTAPVLSRADDWQHLGQDDGRARTTKELSGAAFVGQWRHRLAEGDKVVASPAVADGLVLVAGSTGKLEALRARDGGKVWEADVGGAVATPAIVQGRVVVATMSGKLMALRLADGRVLWENAFGGHDYGSPLPVANADGVIDSVIVAAGFPEKKVARIGLAKGEVLWETPRDKLQDLVQSSPALAGSLVILGLNGGKYQALDVKTGALVWQAVTDGAVYLSSPLADGDRIYMLPGGKDPLLFAVEAKTGKAVPGFPLMMADPAAAPQGKLLAKSVATSSPMKAGDLVVATLRFEYAIEGKDGKQRWELREYVVAIKVKGPEVQVSWSWKGGTRTVETPNDIPGLNLAATPAAWTTGSEVLVAVTSSLSGRVAVLDARTGNERWTAPLAGPARSSPVLANGQLLVGTDGGILHAFASEWNRAPAPPVGFKPTEGATVELSPELKWQGAMDPEGQSLVFELRLDRDGELLQDWGYRVVTGPGETSLKLEQKLEEGLEYVWAVRARDVAGAYSEWSPLQSFRVHAASPVQVAGEKYADLREALLAAVPGQIVRLGKGHYKLSSTLPLPPGLSLLGAGPHETIIDGAGLPVGLSVDGRPGQSEDTTEIANLTVAGARVGIKVAGDQRTRVRNVVLRDNTEIGLLAEAVATVEMANTTVARNGIGVKSSGQLRARNSLVAENASGLVAAARGAIESRYNDVWGNREKDYDGLEAGAGDLKEAVLFADARAGDFRINEAQPTTDMGDPSDPYDQEPVPNGGRVNIGAYGNTSWAELSPEKPAPVAGNEPTPGTAPPGTEGPSGGKRGGGLFGCAVGGGQAGDGGAGALALGLGLLIALRARRRRG